MDIFVPLLVSAGLLVVALLWMGWHTRAWRLAQEGQLDECEHDFRRRQFSRRMQTSGLLAALGIAVFVGIWLPSLPWLVIAYWVGVLALVAWLMLLATADALLTSMHYRRLNDECVVERVRLRRAIDELDATADDPSDIAG